MKLADARPGQRLLDRDGEEYERTLDGARFQGRNRRWVDVTIDVCEAYGPFTLIDGHAPAPSPAWETATTWGEPFGLPEGDRTTPSPGPGWEPFASGMELWISADSKRGDGSHRRWTAWRRKVTP